MGDHKGDQQRGPTFQVNVGGGEETIPEAMKGAPPRELFRFMVYNRSFELAGVAFKWVSICFVAYQVASGVENLAGQNTSASFLLHFISPPSGETRFSAVWPVLSALLTVWALAERTLRYRKVKYLAKRLSKFEQKVDPGRTGSGLAETGETHPKDL